MTRNQKLFRAIVVMGVAVTAPACGDDTPKPDAAPSDSIAQSDAAPTDAGPSDTPVDVVAIL